MFNVDEFIESGILEEYAMGLLPEEEAQKVLKMAFLHPKVRQELNAIEETLQRLAMRSRLEPSPGLRSVIQARAISKSPTVIPRKDFGIPRNQLYGSIAAMLLVAFGAVLAAFFNSKDQMKTLQALYESRIAAMEKHNTELREQLMVANNLRFERTRLSSSSTQNQYALVYANQEALFLCTSYLPEPPAEYQYQLWSIVDDQPRSSGVIPLARKGTMDTMKRFQRTKAYAISVEPVGGSTIPTIDKIVVSGNIAQGNF